MRRQISFRSPKRVGCVRFHHPAVNVRPHRDGRDEADLSLIERLDGSWSLPEALSREEPDLGFLFELEQALAQRERKRAEAPP